MDRPAVTIDRSIIPARISFAVDDLVAITNELTNVTAAVSLPIAVVEIVRQTELHLRFS
jgi:hypothetical protein